MIRRFVRFVVVSGLFVFAAHVTCAQAPTPPASTGAAAPAAAAAPTGPAPHIKFDKTDINLGDVVRGQDAVATFTFQNTGKVPLHILSAKPG